MQKTIISTPSAPSAEIARACRKIAGRAIGKGWYHADDEDFSQDYYLAQLENGMPLVDFAKAQHFHISNNCSPDGKCHRTIGDVRALQGEDGDYIDSAENLASHYIDYPLGAMTDAQQCIFSLLALLDEDFVMCTLGCGESRADQIIDEATDLLIDYATTQDYHGVAWTEMDEDDFRLWLRIMFRPNRTGGGRPKKDNRRDYTRQGGLFGEGVE